MKTDTAKQDSGKKYTFKYKNNSIPTPFQLTDSQTKALKKLIDFVNDDLKEEFITIQGAAGTGKTSTIGLLKQFTGENLVYLAPTHAATTELGMATAKFGNTLMPMTVRSAMNSTYDFKTGKTDWGPSRKLGEALAMGGTMVIDEASMMNNADYQNIKTVARGLGVKIIFMGDKYQIPEVSTQNPSAKEISKAFTENPLIELTEVKRNDDPTVLSIWKALRTNRNGMIPEVANTDKIKYLPLNGFWKDAIKSFKEDPEQSVIISYTNKKVSENNKLMRQQLGYTGGLKVGEAVIGYPGYNAKQLQKGNLSNSVKYTVEEITKDKSKYKISLSSKKIDVLAKAGYEISAKPYTQYRPLSKADIIQFEDTTDNDFETNNTELSGVFRALFNAFTEAKQAKSGYLWKQYFGLLASTSEIMSTIDLGNAYIYNPGTNRMELYIPNHTTKVNGKEYTHAQLKSANPILFVDKGIDFGYAITAHKSQGANIEHVFYDTSDLPKGSTLITEKGTTISSEKHALMYVGITRSKNTLSILKANDGNFYPLGTNPDQTTSAEKDLYDPSTFPSEAIHSAKDLGLDLEEGQFPNC